MQNESTKTISHRELNESEDEELVRLRAENAYIKAENEVIKNEAEQLKVRKQRLLKRSDNKAIN